MVDRRKDFRQVGIQINSLFSPYIDFVSKMKWIYYLNSNLKLPMKSVSKI